MKKNAFAEKVKNYIFEHRRIIIFTFSTLLLIGIYIIIYFNNGMEFVYAHLVYLPIIIFSMYFGVTYGIAAALISGIIIGPVMSIAITPTVASPFWNWILRLIMYLFIGYLTGTISDNYRKKVKELDDYLKVNQYTLIPNISYFKSLEPTNEMFTPITVIISKREYFLDLFGLDNVNRIIHDTFENLSKYLPDGSKVFQADANKLWVLVKDTNIEDAKEFTLDALDHEILINTASIYVEYYLSFGNPVSFADAQNLHVFSITDRCARIAEKNNIKYVEYKDLKEVNEYDYDLLSDFNNALKYNETYLAYHPVYDINSYDIIKLEALIRWMHPVKGLINPDDFIPLIENTQLIHPLMEWVLDNVLDKINEFKKAGINIRIFLNISAKNFYNRNFVYKIMRKLDDKQVNPHSLGIEITESVLFNNLDESREMVKQLTELGIAISIDDFGKGYSSLSYLSHFTINYLKVDKEFIYRIDDPTTLIVIKATTDLAKNLNFETVAEGIENEYMLKRVRDLGFDFVQGFYFCKPVHQDEIIDFYIKDKKDKANK